MSPGIHSMVRRVLKCSETGWEELYVNILLHNYIADNEPVQLPAFKLFPQMVIGGGTARSKYASLSDVKTKYNEIGRNHPRNYGWYLCHLHAAAGRIYDVTGKQVNRKIWDRQ